MEKTASKQVAELTKAPKIKPNLRPILPIIFAAKIVKIAVPRTDKAVGNVDKDFIEVICDPTIPLKKTVIILAVNPKTWLKASSDKFLFTRHFPFYFLSLFEMSTPVVGSSSIPNGVIFLGNGVNVDSGLSSYGLLVILYSPNTPIIK